MALVNPLLIAFHPLKNTFLVLFLIDESATDGLRLFPIVFWNLDPILKKGVNRSSVWMGWSYISG